MNIISLEAQHSTFCDNTLYSDCIQLLLFSPDHYQKQCKVSLLLSPSVVSMLYCAEEFSRRTPDRPQRRMETHWLPAHPLWSRGSQWLRPVVSVGVRERKGWEKRCVQYVRDREEECLHERQKEWKVCIQGITMEFRQQRIFCSFLRLTHDEICFATMKTNVEESSVQGKMKCLSLRVETNIQVYTLRRTHIAVPKVPISPYHAILRPRGRA